MATNVCLEKDSPHCGWSELHGRVRSRGSAANLVRGGLKKKRRRRNFFGGRFYGGFDLKWCPSRALNLASKQESQIKALLRLAATEVVKNHKEIF